MQSLISRKTTQSISPSIAITEDVTSDEFMIARGFHRLSEEEAAPYARLAHCAAKTTPQGLFRKLVHGLIR